MLGVVFHLLQRVFHYFKPQTVWHWKCCSLCDMRHVTVSNHIQSRKPSASSFALGGWDVSATSNPRRFEWVKMNRDRRCSETHSH